MMLVNTEKGNTLTLTLKYTAGRLRQTSTPRYLPCCPHSRLTSTSLFWDDYLQLRSRLISEVAF